VEIKKKLSGDNVAENPNYKVSFFKPTTPFSRKNRNVVIVLLLIWAVAIYGFQILLKVMETPTPEPALVTFEKVWPDVKSGNAVVEQKKEFAQSILMVLGKSSLTAPKRAVLENALSWVAFDLMPQDQKEDFKATVTEFETIKKNIKSLSDEKYIQGKKKIISMVAPTMDLPEYSLQAKLLPLELKSSEMETFIPENQEKTAGIMQLYLTHNRSVLTDTIFLGFPFHYFYTAVFLLTLFIALCWIYCFIIDRMHTQNVEA